MNPESFLVASVRSHRLHPLMWVTLGIGLLVPGWDMGRLMAANTTNAVLRVERPSRTEPVDFEREILPILQGSCLPCHNRTTTKADLLLETPADMLRGGESGPALVPGKASESLLFRLSTHEAKPRMPPKDNKVNAVNLTPAELGLLATWIDQGAKASEKRALVIRWENPSEAIRSVYALASTVDGGWVAAGSGNRLRVYDTASGRAIQELTDPALGTNHVAHRDLVNSVAISADGEWIASGGYREIKLWRRKAVAPVWKSGGVPGAGVFPATNAVSPAGGRMLRRTAQGAPELVGTNGADGLVLWPGPRLPDADPVRLRAVAQSGLDAGLKRVESSEKELKAQQERWKKAVEALTAATLARQAKVDAETRLKTAATIAEAVVDRARRRGAVTNDLKVLQEKASAALKAVEPATKELTAAQVKLDAAGEESRLAEIGRNRAEMALAMARQAVLESKRTLASATVETTWPTLRAAAWSSDGSHVAVLCEGRVHVWNARRGAWIASASAREGSDRIQFEGTGRIRIGRSAAGDSADWDFGPGWEWVRTLGSDGDDSPLTDRVNALAFRSDGLRLASGSGEPTRGGDVRVWEPATGRHLYGFTNLHSDAVLALAWSPDGQRLATGGADRFARVLDVADGRAVAVLEGHTGHVLSVSWRADGRVVATGGAEGAVKFWTLGTADKPKTVGGLGKEIVALCHLGTGGDVLAVPGDRDLVRITESGEKPATLPGAKDFLHAAASTADGRWVFGGGQEGVVRLWDVEAKKVLRELGH